MDFMSDTFVTKTVHRFGSVDVTLCSRGPAAPCHEALVMVPWSVDDLGPYLRFHRSFVRHRARENWPHKFLLVYDVRNFHETSLASVGDFVAMQNSLGDDYLKLLLCTVVIFRDESQKEVLDSVLRMLGQPERCILGATPATSTADLWRRVREVQQADQKENPQL